MSADKEKTAKGDLGLLEEDDEFEEFPAEGTQDFVKLLKCVSVYHKFVTLLDFNAVQEDEDDVNVWEDNWDDDNVEDDFNVQLKAHLEKQVMET